MRRAAEEVKAAYPRLTFSESGERRLTEVLDFLAQPEERQADLGERATTPSSWAACPTLKDYGGPLSDTDPRRRFRVEVTGDFHPQSFGLYWHALNRLTGEYPVAMTGGLVWHGGPIDAHSVCLDPNVLWGIHT